jgi:hypothetical protein
MLASVQISWIYCVAAATMNRMATQLVLLAGYGATSVSFTRFSIVRPPLSYALQANYRFINHHGQELTRLSRDQAIFVRSAAESSRIPRFWSKWLFGAPDQYLSRFDTVFVDEFLHAHDWRRFMATAHQDWRISIAFSFLYLL